MDGHANCKLDKLSLIRESTVLREAADDHVVGWVSENFSANQQLIVLLWFLDCKSNPTQSRIPIVSHWRLIGRDLILITYNSPNG